MYCTNCGKYNEEDKSFCTNCGSPLNNRPETAKAKQPSKPQPANKAGTGKGFNPVPYLIAAVAIVFIISAAAAAVSIFGTSGRQPEELVYKEPETEETRQTETAVPEQTTEAATETVTELQTEAPTLQPETEIEPPYILYGFDDSYSVWSSAEKYAPELLNLFYSYAWVQTTNNHDSSYVKKFTGEDSEAYYMLGLEYWQERPAVSFNRIYDVTVYGFDISKFIAGESNEIDVYVSYKYEIYDSETGKTRSNIELAVDGVNWYSTMMENGEYKHTLLLYDHTWVNDLPLGTTVTLEDFKQQ